jgi:type IV secretory pathway VirB10-like protein
VRTLYFSRTHGTKLDTIVKELKQGATADLLPQKPAASSDEERLAAGISTIGLQTKRLSGAQWKKLMREKKMKEGTWMAEKPPRKTPPSQTKETARSSGGVKRPDSDSSSPSLGKQQPKKPRSTRMQTGTYKEAVTGIRMAIIHRRHPEVKLDQAQTDVIQEKLLTAVDADPAGEIPVNSYTPNLHREFFESPVQMNQLRNG